MLDRMRKLALVSLAGMLALALVTLVSPVGIGSSQAQQGAMHNCPQPGKWAIAVWDGDEGTNPEEAFTTCGAGMVDAAYWIDPATQAWRHWFPCLRDVSNLGTIKELQGVIALGAPAALCSGHWPTTIPQSLLCELIAKMPVDEPNFRIEYGKACNRFFVTVQREPAKDSADEAVQWFKAQGVDDHCKLDIAWTATMEIIKTGNLDPSDFPTCG